jgi:hypothetical protein
MHAFLREVRDILVSLKLTLTLLVFSMVLVFAATLDQVNLGVWAVQAKYFRSFIVYTQVGPVVLPVFPGGYTIGGLLLANLIAAHVFRFAFAWRKAGIVLAHAGLILLLIGELISGLWQEDLHMRIGEGETASYAESFREHELALVETTNATFNDVVAIPESLLERKQNVQHPKLPFRVVTKTYYPNSSLHRRAPTESSAAPGGDSSVQASAGFGTQIAASPEPVTFRPDESNQPTAIIEVIGAEGSLGTYLVSTQLVMPQEITHGGRTWTIALRLRRVYQPFTLTLLKFDHDRYAGTNIPKNFSSRLRLRTPDGRDDRDVLVYMNNPLRYGGLTFYQAGFENNDRTTILQVVRNPSWLIPYIACGLMTLGLVVQFGIHLVGFVVRRRPRTEPAFAKPATSARAALPSAS